MKIYQLAFESHIRFDSGLVRRLRNHFRLDSGLVRRLSNHRRLDSGLVRPASRGTSALSKRTVFRAKHTSRCHGHVWNAGRGELMRPWVLIETDDVGLTFEN